MRCSVDHFAWLSTLFNELQGTMQSVLVHTGLSLKTTARPLFSHLNGLLLFRYPFKVCFKNCPDSAAKPMYQNTHYVVIAVTATAKRLLRPQWWLRRAGCHKKEQQKVQTPVLPPWAARPGATRRQDHGAPLPSACQGGVLTYSHASVQGHT